MAGTETDLRSKEIKRAATTASRKPRKKAGSGAPTRSQLHWLKRGMAQPGGKLPLFDEDGQEISPRTVHACIEHGWVEPWFSNPLKPDWLVCKLTDAGRRQVEGK